MYSHGKGTRNHNMQKKALKHSKSVTKKHAEEKKAIQFLLKFNRKFFVLFSLLLSPYKSL